MIIQWSSKIIIIIIFNVSTVLIHFHPTNQPMGWMDKISIIPIYDRINNNHRSSRKVFQSDGCHADAVNKDKSFQPNFKHPFSSTKVYPFQGYIPSNKLA